MSVRLANNASDAQERRNLRAMAMAVIEAHPVLGVGAGTYSFEFGKYLPSDVGDTWLYVVHNAYLLRWAETGVLGFVGLIALFIFAARDARRLLRSDDEDFALFGVAWLGGLTALAWEMYWDVWGGFPYNALLWALCGFAVAAQRIDWRRRAGVRSV
jgi:O-antigen ligase